VQRVVKKWRDVESIVVMRARIQRAEVIVDLVRSGIERGIEVASVAAVLIRNARADVVSWTPLTGSISDGDARDALRSYRYVEQEILTRRPGSPLQI
jgi:hypothetical protein